LTISRVSGGAGSPFSAEQPLHLYLDATHFRAAEGFVTAPWPPGVVRLRAVLTDEAGDVALEDELTLHVLPPPPSGKMPHV
jgi:hypothetical protein